MPELGEIRLGREIGKKPYQAFIWTACVDCGKERWVNLIKGQPRSQRCCSCASRVSGLNQICLHQVGNKWKGGRSVCRGYIGILLRPDDFFYPMANSKGYVLEHRLVMAKHLGRCLHPWEIVHHKRTKYPLGSIENKADNRIENLQLISDDRHNQITILETKIRRLETKVKNQDTLIRLLQKRGKN